jgi:hypothetical protein
MLPPPLSVGPVPGETPPEGSPVPGCAGGGFGVGGRGVGVGRTGGVGSAGACAQSGSPGAQAVVRAAVRPGAGGPEGLSAEAETAVPKPKKSRIGRVAEIATVRFLRVDL